MSQPLGHAAGVDAAMSRAVDLAARALGRTSPNPVVGCVVLDADGRVAGEGLHEFAGGPHAEVNALREAGERARGGTAVVTLEPCRHTGRTGPCTQALLDAGVARVVIAVPDPTGPAGGGAQELRDAGVEVLVGTGREAAEHVNRAWLHAMALARPHVTWKLAATLDGRTAAADGTSRWITGPEARAEVHRLRARSDAVLVGGGTLRADDPHLAVREVTDAVQPLRVVLDSTAGIPLSARVLDDAAPTLVVVAEGADTDHLVAAGVDVLAVRRATLPAHGSRSARTGALGDPAGVGGLDLAAVLAALHGRGIRSVLLEGGAHLAGSFVAADLVDEVVAHVAPVLLGNGSPVLQDADITTITEALRLTTTDVTRLGDDVAITATVRRDH
ncbi:bifunctional diaminohydroxyphosphoribosylaminopyrimidine deaminase/5-amino-6-(5-phosphoribosylamino)uracil reductase RibD [Janibacter cremeus]|uniref:bifunctional diaminohydroxyphosphoribosylaminopyrimidine deaminase/5-amino-6-(5-phosphoribosylamino)uracil reductase RibD n=1 Tax=Janibacter cremeus TaxID=1285192 RepID=UPI0023F67254|nr:bifunctional diaminohydroxyphosphoribosylaminopyrimidine deaminase/5-amino-6-(5-phosphoribosylamino)uracil reductase RibD [Janibacter cremeus]WEV79728.1 bifunctional diaminohydroxyphosphoribosylaminopyrimidine deaminase/5-amino-6-(5-phosphoribosylamino)uracil reductase RibD [Janibacter cremeus]